MKRVYIEPGWRVHSYYKTVALHPPDGYEFVLGVSPLHRWSKASAGSHLVEGSVLRKLLTSLNHCLDRVRGSHFSYRLQHEILERALPVNLVKSYLERRLTPPPGIDLTVAVNHLVLRQEPWILEAEHIAFCLSYRGEWLDSARLRGFLERVLSSSWCRKIVSSSEAAQRSVLRYLNCEGFGEARHFPRIGRPRKIVADKLVVVPFALPVKPFNKAHRDNGNVKLLFVGTTNLPGRFYDRGGLEVLECFRILRQRYPNVELVVRSEVPAGVKSQFAGLPGLQILDSPIPAEAVAAEYSSADIFLSPADHTPWSSVLEAMSYELPVVATDVFANRELVRDGESGFLVPIPNAGKRGPHQDVVEGLVEKVSILVQDVSLREHMGKAGRREVEEGSHSIRCRNKKLREVLDEATADFPIVPIPRLGG